MEVYMLSSQVSFLLRLKAAFYKNRRDMVSAVGDGADDWIIGGQSLSAHCKRIRYVEKDDRDSVAQTESVASIQAIKTNSKIRKDLLEPVVL
jgi:hypothetical protein